MSELQIAISRSKRGLPCVWESCYHCKSPHFIAEETAV